MDRPSIVIVWLKRDLRLEDHEPMARAIASGHPVLLLYVYEPTLLHDHHYSDRHWRFIQESITDMNSRLARHHTAVLTIMAEMIPAFERLSSHYTIEAVYSHQETGLAITYERDKKIKQYLAEHAIPWYESIQHGVFRGRRTRKTWLASWRAYMAEPVIAFDGSSAKWVDTTKITELCRLLSDEMPALLSPSDDFQPGGETMAWRYAESFFASRHRQYQRHISKPAASRRSCSRLSPYIAWGCVSMRAIYQRGLRCASQGGSKRDMRAFLDRLRWQAHFIQKFEMESSMEFRSVNRGYAKLDKPVDSTLQAAWREGQTGYPLVDAAMRCLIQTGYVNFRMRAMLVSFFTHLLWQPWQDCAAHLARVFLDFEPGIHYPQIQMQAGETGINIVRIYSPIRNAQLHDPDGTFIKRYVPELAGLAPPAIHAPYEMTLLEQQMMGCVIGVDYPHPVIDLDTRRKQATDVLWSMKKDPNVRAEAKRILKKHTLPGRKPQR